MINFDLNEEDYIKLQEIVIDYCEKNRLDEDKHLDLMEDFLSEPRESEKSSLFIWQVLHSKSSEVDNSVVFKKIKDLAKEQYKKSTSNSIYH